jgi:large subunit ribosomal protein L29
MKNADVKKLSIDELNENIKVEGQKLHKLKFAHAISPIENPMQIRDTRKNIARLQTELRSKVLAK